MHSIIAFFLANLLSRIVRSTCQRRDLVSVGSDSVLLAKERQHQVFLPAAVRPTGHRVIAVVVVVVVVVVVEGGTFINLRRKRRR